MHKDVGRHCVTLLTINWGSSQDWMLDSKIFERPRVAYRLLFSLALLRLYNNQYQPTSSNGCDAHRGIRLKRQCNCIDEPVS